jgi:hypothetical protein
VLNVRRRPNGQGEWSGEQKNLKAVLAAGWVKVGIKEEKRRLKGLVGGVVGDAKAGEMTAVPLLWCGALSGGLLQVNSAGVAGIFLPALVPARGLGKRLIDIHGTATQSDSRAPITPCLYLLHAAYAPFIVPAHIEGRPPFLSLVSYSSY